MLRNKLLNFFYSILILFIFFECKSFQSKKTSIQEIIPIEKIHWYQYYQIVEVPFFYKNKFTDYLMQNEIEFYFITNKNDKSYFKINSEKIPLVEKLTYTRITKDFPFIWWDSELTNRLKTKNIEIIKNGYKDYSAIVEILMYLKNKYPDFIQLSTIGKSLLYNNIYLLHISNHNIKNDYKIPVYFNSLHHGNELLSVEYILDMIFLLLGENYIQTNNISLNIINKIEESKRKEILNQLDIYIIPVVNPDGLNHFWYTSIHKGRKNSRNVDLNRNYPFYWNSNVYDASSSQIDSYNYRGNYPASEKEVQTIITFLKNNPCSFGISYHTFASKILVPYTVEHAWNPIPDRAYYFAKEIIKNSISFRKINYRIVRKLYSVDGTDQDWIYNSTGCLSYIVEGSMNLPQFDIAKYSIVGIRNIWYNILNIAITEKRIELEFYDNNHKRILPDIKVLNYKFFQNEYFLPYNNRWIFYLGPLSELKIEVSYKKTKKILNFFCNDICREKIYLTNYN